MEMIGRLRRRAESLARDIHTRAKAAYSKSYRLRKKAEKCRKKTR